MNDFSGDARGSKPSLSNWHSSSLQDRLALLASLVAEWQPKSNTQPEQTQLLLPGFLRESLRPNSNANPEGLRVLLPNFLPESLRWFYQIVAEHGTQASNRSYGDWTSGCPIVTFHWLRRPESLTIDESGVIEFLNEDQGVYQCGVLAKGLDPCAVTRDKGDTAWEPLADRLSDFLLVLLVFELSFQNEWGFMAGTFRNSAVDVVAKNMLRLDFDSVSWMKRRHVSTIHGEGLAIFALPESNEYIYLQAAAKSRPALEELRAFGKWEV